MSATLNWAASGNSARNSQLSQPFTIHILTRLSRISVARGNCYLNFRPARRFSAIVR